MSKNMKVLAVIKHDQSPVTRAELTLDQLLVELTEFERCKKLELADLEGALQDWREWHPDLLASYTIRERRILEEILYASRKIGNRRVEKFALHRLRKLR